MDAAQIYDIEYPGATLSTVSTVIADSPMTIAEMVAKVGGTFETTRVVLPTQIEYDYIPIARDSTHPRLPLRAKAVQPTSR